MANWAALQETLIAKPVVKRAKHGIHFQDGKQITAVFSGKPCHYFDGKLWKPIDTKPVLRKDGWFGCPHSDVIIHPDGTVKVGTYQQKASLISASEGKIDGDRIVRPFSGGVQYLYIKEDGFRQEIVLEKMPDLKQASALLDTVSGTLPTKYKASALSVKDSTTAELADSVVLADAKSLATYLEKAVYPVTIDPDFLTDTSDGNIRGESTAYATARATSTEYNSSAGSWIVGQRVTTYPEYSVFRGYIKFDTSSIGAGSTITQVNLDLILDAKNVTTNNFDVQIAKYDWSQWAGAQSNATYRETAFDGALSADADDSIWKNTADVVTQQHYSSGNLSTAWVSKTGTTYYALRSSRDVSGTAPTPGGSIVQEEVTVYSANDATSSKHPYLTVTYTVASSLHTLSLLGVGK